ncbi:MAG: radical SAM protein [Nanoarchaeota archaeon]
MKIYKRKQKIVPLIEKIRGDGTKDIVRRSTRRFVMQMGFACNARCSFCYYLDSIKAQTTKDFSTNEVKSRFREAKSLGIDQVDISGGEPTIRPDLLEIIKYAKDIGFVKICIITNGIRLADEKYANSLVDAGLNDILFSTHGTTKEEHENLVNISGSFDRIWKAVDNISKRKEVELRFNMTITNLNFEHCDKLFEKIKPYAPSEVNLLVFNPSQEATNTSDEKVRFANYNQIGDALSKSIQKYKDQFKVINVRWMPYCMLKGHEEHVRTMWQKMYEDKEWDPYLNIKHNLGIFPVVGAFIAGLVVYPFRAPRYNKRGLYTKFNEVLSTYRQLHYYKHLKPCSECSLKKICPGLPKDYVEKFDKTELKPYSGEVIQDPLHFCKKYEHKFTSLRL